MRDAEADKAALLVHGRSAPAQKSGAGQTAAGAVEPPLPFQAQRAMADAIQKREGAQGNDEAMKNLVLEEQRVQVDLEKRLAAELEKARDSLAADGVNELRTSLDAVRAWGHSLAFEARKYKPK